MSDLVYSSALEILEDIEDLVEDWRTGVAIATLPLGIAKDIVTSPIKRIANIHIDAKTRKFEKEKEQSLASNPDVYYREYGRCPAGYRYKRRRCQKVEKKLKASKTSA